MLGVGHILQYPAVLSAISPLHGVMFLAHHGQRGLLVLGGVFLAVTGGEALYADLGHFGRKPIRLAWFSVVFPALLMNYFGQGALLIEHPEAIENPFFRMVPSFALYPVVLLSTCATVIASQALISGVYSLTSQATMLGFLPRFSIRHTSADERGQIYIPSVNYVLMFAAIGLVLGFKSSTRVGRCLRHRRHADDDHHHRAGVLPGALRLGLGLPQGDSGHAGVLHSGDVLRQRKRRRRSSTAVGCRW